MPIDEEIRSLIIEIARALVDDQHGVRAEIEEANGLVTVNLRVQDSDLGKIIGKQGRTARSLRTILGAVSMKCRRRYHLNIQPRDSVEVPVP